MVTTTIREYTVTFKVRTTTEQHTGEGETPTPTTASHEIIDVQHNGKDVELGETPAGGASYTLFEGQYYIIALVEEHL